MYILTGMYKLCMYVLCMYAYMHTYLQLSHPQRQDEGVSSPITSVKHGCELACWC